MKKLILAFAVMGLIGLNSCKQDWVCQCNAQDGTVTNTPINGGTFHHAKSTCNGMNLNTTVAGVHESESCSLLTQER